MLEYIRTDYESQTDKDLSYLHTICGRTTAPVGFERYSYIKQAVEVFVTRHVSNKRLTVDLGFNASQDNVPKIHITMPSESSSV